MVVNFRGDQIFVDFVRFLIHEVLPYTGFICATIFSRIAQKLNVHV